MVNYALDLDAVFGSLSDPIRRDILKRVAKASLTVSEIARSYDVSLPAISKHLKIMERAKLINKQRHGKEQMVKLAPQTLAGATEYLNFYAQLWDGRFEALDKYLKGEL